MNVKKSNSYNKDVNRLSDDLENKYIHKGMIFVSIYKLLFIKCIGNFLKNIGSNIEDFLDGNEHILNYASTIKSFIFFRYLYVL